VTEKLMDELAQCYNVLPQLDINNTIDHRPEGDEKWFLRSEERFSRNAETDIVCRLLLEKKTMFTIALVRFPPTASYVIQYLNSQGALTFTSIVRHPLMSTLFPYTTLFRSLLLRS